MRLNLAYTARINPPGVTPVLTVDQVWQGLERKIRYAHEFVPVIESCEVLEDKDGVVKRHVVFKDGMGPVKSANETVRGSYPAWVDFEQENGLHVKNVISNGPGFGPEELHMTYMFEFDFPHVPDDDREAVAKQLKETQTLSRQAVDHSIDTIREMVKDGRIKN